MIGTKILIPPRMLAIKASLQKEQTEKLKDLSIKACLIALVTGLVQVMHRRQHHFISFF